MNTAIQAELERAASHPVVVDITTTGRTSGEPRRIEIWIVSVDDRVLIGGTPGRRDWIANLRADDRLTLHLKEGVTADVEARATEITDPDDRRTIWSHRSTSWYRSQTTIDELVADAPLVELELDDPA